MLILNRCPPVTARQGEIRLQTLHWNYRIEGLEGEKQDKKYPCSFFTGIKIGKEITFIFRKSHD